MDDTRAAFEQIAQSFAQVLPQWKPVGAFAENLYAIRPYSAHVPRAVTAFAAYLREALSDGFGEGIRASERTE